MPFKTVAVRYNTRLTIFVQLPEIFNKCLLWNRSQNGCHSIFDGIHVRKTCTFDGHLQSGKQEVVRRSQIRGVRRMIKHSYNLLSQELAQTDRSVCRGILSWSSRSIYFPVLCNSGRTRRIRCSNRFKTAGKMRL